MDEVRQLTAAIASGDREAFARFYTAKFDSMFVFARRFTGLDESRCLDIVQDSMMRAIKSIKPLPDLAALEAWLATVVRSVARDHLRRERRRRLRELAAFERSPAFTVRVEADRQERVAWLRTELARLDGAAADLVAMRFGAGMTLETIGERTGLQAGAVHGRLSRLISGLRSRVKEQAP